MAVTVEIFYSFQSPYSYLAMDRIYELKAKHPGIEFLFQPFSAKAAGQTVPSATVIPDKLSYLFDDTTRFAREANLPLAFPQGWPENEYDPGRITRGAIVASDMEVLTEYNLIVFNKVWGLGQNPNEENFINELCEDLDIELGEFLSKLSASDTRERVKGIYTRGRKLGVFDTPTFVIGQERIYGIDKLGYLAQRLAEIDKR